MICPSLPPHRGGITSPLGDEGANNKFDMFKKLLYSLHRILGTILSILFLVWFLSGFVMIYHTFPKVANRDKYAHMDAVSGYMPEIDSIINSNHVGNAVNKLTLRDFDGHSYFEVVTEERSYKLPADTNMLSIGSPAYTQIENYAKKWSDADIVKVDTLRELEQWIPFGYLRKDFPIYKFYFDDEKKHQLYVSSVTGEALQFTNKDNRFWAWVGAIPHWIYFTKLRQDSQLWIDVVVWLSGIGCIMCIAGIILGVRSYIVQHRKKKHWKTPYKKFSYKWHHILGFVFGIFVFTYVFSGMMSLATVPKWMVKVHNPDIQKQMFISNPVVLSDYKLDYRKVIEKYPNQVKRIEWTYFGDVPLYKVIIDNKEKVIDASGEELKPLSVTEQMIKDKLSKTHSEPITITELHEYDNYYVGTSNHLPLPVYKAELADADNSTYYINPKNGNTRYFNTNTKVRRWSYQVLHSWELGFLVKRPVLWNIVMWVTMIGGTLVSLTGVWLGLKYIKRKSKRLKKYLYAQKNKH